MARQVRVEQTDSRWFRRRKIGSLAIAVLGVVATGITMRLLEQPALQFLTPMRDLIIAVELVALGIAAVETASRAIRRHYTDIAAHSVRDVISRLPDREYIQRRSVVFRAVFRTVAYGALGVAASSSRTTSCSAKRLKRASAFSWWLPSSAPSRIPA